MNETELFFNEKEKDYNPLLGTIHFKFDSREVVDTSNLREFLEKFITYYNENYVSFYKGDDRRVTPYPGCRRSLREIYLLTCEHFGKVSLYDCAKGLYSLVMDRSSSVYCNFCKEIRELVFFNYPWKQSGYESKAEIYSRSEEGLLKLSEYGTVDDDFPNVGLYHNFSRISV